MSVPIVIVDKRAPQQAIDALRHNFEVFLFNSQGCSYDAISGHPDVFMFQHERKLILAPNTPKDCVTFLNNRQILFVFGQKRVGELLAESVLYNCLTSNNRLFHKQGFTDKVVLDLTAHYTFINLPQAYTRCSLLALGNDRFITSDKGIEAALKCYNLDCLCISPQGILLHSYKHGFLAGCMGIFEQTLYVMGSLASLEQGIELRDYIGNSGLAIEELYQGSLFDVGGLFFMETD